MPRKTGKRIGIGQASEAWERQKNKPTPDQRDYLRDVERHRPVIDYANQEQVERLRSGLAGVAIEKIKVNPGGVRNYNNLIKRNLSLVHQTLYRWGSPGQLEFPHMTEEDRTDPRLRTATRVAMHDHGVKDWGLVNPVSSYAFSALSEASRFSIIREHYGPGDIDVWALDSSTRLAELRGRPAVTTERTAPIPAANLSAEAMNRFAARYPDDPPRVHREVTRSVVGDWVQPDAGQRADRLRTRYAGYKGDLDNIAFQLLWHQEDRMPQQMPSDLFTIVPGVIQEACAESGLDFAVLNTSAGRERLPYFPIS